MAAALVALSAKLLKPRMGISSACAKVSPINILRSIPVGAAVESGELQRMTKGELAVTKVLDKQACALQCSRWQPCRKDFRAEIFASNESAKLL